MKFKLTTGDPVDIMESLGDGIFKVQISTTKRILLVMLMDLDEGCRAAAEALPCAGDGLMWASDKKPASIHGDG